jgi:hypothetical protein
MKTYDEVINEIKASVIKKVESNNMPAMEEAFEEVKLMRKSSNAVYQIMTSDVSASDKGEVFKKFAKVVETTIMEEHVTRAMLKEAVIMLVDMQLDDTECDYPKCLDNEDERCPKLLTGECKEKKDI